MEEESSSSSGSERLFLLGMVASMFCWGLSWASGKILTSYGTPMQIAFFRFMFTFFSLLIVLLFKGDVLTIKSKGLRDLFAAALLIALYTYFFFKGLTEGKAGAGGVLVTTLNPVISYFIMIIVTKKMPAKRQLLGLLVGILGGCILLKIWKDWHEYLGEGNSFFLMASFSWAILSLFTSRSSRYGSPVVFSLWMYGICSFMLFLTVGIDSSMELIRRSDIKLWANLFFSGTITTAIATTFYFVATAKIGAGKASSYIFMVPLSAALGSWLFLGEVPLMHTIAGGFLAITAVYLINSKPKA